LHWYLTAKRLNPHEIALARLRRESERSHQALANAKLRCPRTDSSGDEGAVRQLADGFPVHDYRYLGGDGHAINPEHKYQGASGRRNSAVEIPLGVSGEGQEETK
jgi:hypothetical protein